jgi:hypothetical protein
MPIPKPYRFANFINTELLQPVAFDDNVMFIPQTVAQQMPTLTDPEQLMLALWDGQRAPEIVACTANPQNGMMTVVRAQESTSALAWDAGTQVKCILSAGIIDSALQAYFDLPGQLTGYFLPIQGGTMLGELFLAPTSNPAQNEAVPRSYVDGIGAGFMQASGATVMTGDLQMGGHSVTGLALADPPNDNYATSKKYVDAKFASASSGGSARIDDDSYGIPTTGTDSAYTANVTNNRGALLANWDLTTITIRPHLRNLANATLTLTLGGNPVALAGPKPILQGGTLSNPIVQRVLQKDVPYRLTYVQSIGGWIVHGMFLPVTESNTGKIEWEPVPANTVKPGFVRLIGETLALTSGAAYLGVDYKELYLYNYAKFDDTICKVGLPGYVRTTALADWNANQPLTLLDMRGRGPAGVDTTAAPTGRISAVSIVTGAIDKPGSSGGLDKRKILQADLPAYNLSNGITINITGGANSLVGLGGAGGLADHDSYNAAGSGPKDLTYPIVVGGGLQNMTARVIGLSGNVGLNGGAGDFKTMDPFLLGTFFQRL